jgi:hypothetical protein
MEYKSPSLGVQLTEALGDENLADVTVNPSHLIDENNCCFQGEMHGLYLSMIAATQSSGGESQFLRSAPLVIPTSPPPPAFSARLTRPPPPPPRTPPRARGPSLAASQFIVGPERRTVRGLRIVMAARNKNLRHMLYNDRNDDGTLRSTYERPQARDGRGGGGSEGRGSEPGSEVGSGGLGG